MSKPAEIELIQLKSAINYLAAFLDEGTLVQDRYDKATREQFALVLEQLVQKVEGLPEGVPENLIQAAAVRAIIGATEKVVEIEKGEFAEEIQRSMRDAEAAASIKGCILGEWEIVSDIDLEYQATCQNCRGFVYVSPGDTFDLLPEQCPGS